MSRTYERLPLVEFSQHLLATGDLDPVYVALNRLQRGVFGDTGPVQRNRWLTAYCAFYHVGAACWLSEKQGDDFWHWMIYAAANKDTRPTPTNERWPRAKERRHFRGGQAIRAVDDWKARWPAPEDMFAHIAGHGGYAGPRPQPFAAVRARALAHLSVGEWLSFKMVDLVDACCGERVDQSDAAPFLYDAPRKMMLKYWRDAQGLPDTAKPKDERVVLEGVMEHVGRKIGPYKLPHDRERTLDRFALETCFCKWGSHLSGHYPLFNDIDEISHGLEPWAKVSQTAAEFLAAMPTR